MLSSYSHQKNILQSANNLLSNSVLYNVIELKKLNSKGCRLNLYKCDSCDKLFNHMNDEPIYGFFCGHKFHLKCCSFKDGQEMICEICKKNEFDYQADVKQAPLSPLEQTSRREYINEVTENYKKNRNEQHLNKLLELDRMNLEKELLINLIK